MWKSFSSSPPQDNRISTTEDFTSNGEKVNMTTRISPSLKSILTLLPQLPVFSLHEKIFTFDS
jgi:hypothetical protein